MNERKQRPPKPVPMVVVDLNDDGRVQFPASVLRRWIEVENLIEIIRAFGPLPPELPEPNWADAAENEDLADNPGEEWQ